jgi:transmembrane sensor
MIRLRQVFPAMDAQEAALWWAARRMADPDRFARDKRFERWLADPANAAAWSEIEQRIDATAGFAAMPEIRTMRAEALKICASARPRSWKFYWAGGGLAFAAGLAALLVFTPVVNPIRSEIASSASAVQRYSTAIGERRDLRLPDGSRVALNTGTTVEVQYTPDRRNIRLITGQAIFRVAHNIARPFMVAAGGRTITATGTAFDVRVAPDGKVSVLLIEGRVHVDPARASGLARIIPVLAREDLDPGQRLTAASSADEPTVSAADVDRGTAWDRGMMIFRRDRLGDAIEEANRYSTTQLVVDDPRIANLTISGIFPTSRQEDFIAAITAFYPIRVDRRAPGALILSWRADATS